LFGFPAFDAQSKFTRCVSGLEVVVAPGRLPIKALSLESIGLCVAWHDL